MNIIMCCVYWRLAFLLTSNAIQGEAFIGGRQLLEGGIYWSKYGRWWDSLLPQKCVPLWLKLYSAHVHFFCATGLCHMWKYRTSSCRRVCWIAYSLRFASIYGNWLTNFVSVFAPGTKVMPYLSICSDSTKTQSRVAQRDIADWTQNIQKL